MIKKFAKIIKNSLQNGFLIKKNHKKSKKFEKI